MLLGIKQLIVTGFDIEDEALIIDGVRLFSIDGSYELQARTSPWRAEPWELAVSVA